MSPVHYSSLPVLLGHIPTVRNLLDVGHGLRPLDAVLLHEEPGHELGLGVDLLLHAETALGVGQDLALGLQHLTTHLLLLVLALLDELRGAGLGLLLPPLDGREGGDVDTELATVKVRTVSTVSPSPAELLCAASGGTNKTEEEKRDGVHVSGVTEWRRAGATNIQTVVTNCDRTARFQLTSILVLKRKNILKLLSGSVGPRLISTIRFL